MLESAHASGPCGSAVFCFFAPIIYSISSLFPLREERGELVRRVNSLLRVGVGGGERVDGRGGWRSRRERRERGGEKRTFTHFGSWITT